MVLVFLPPWWFCRRPRWRTWRPVWTAAWSKATPTPWRTYAKSDWVTACWPSSSRRSCTWSAWGTRGGRRSGAAPGATGDCHAATFRRGYTTAGHPVSNVTDEFVLLCVLVATNLAKDVVLLLKTTKCFSVICLSIAVTNEQTTNIIFPDSRQESCTKKKKSNQANGPREEGWTSGLRRCFLWAENQTKSSWFQWRGDSQGSVPTGGRSRYCSREQEALFNFLLGGELPSWHHSISQQLARRLHGTNSEEVKLDHNGVWIIDNHRNDVIILSSRSITRSPSLNNSFTWFVKSRDCKWSLTDCWDVCQWFINSERKRRANASSKYSEHRSRPRCSDVIHSSKYTPFCTSKLRIYKCCG